jgi:hypothetical protein
MRDEFWIGVLILLGCVVCSLNCGSVSEMATQDPDGGSIKQKLGPGGHEDVGGSSGGSPGAGAAGGAAGTGQAAKGGAGGVGGGCDGGGRVVVNPDGSVTPLCEPRGSDAGAVGNTTGGH